MGMGGAAGIVCPCREASAAGHGSGGAGGACQSWQRTATEGVQATGRRASQNKQRSHRGLTLGAKPGKPRVKAVMGRQ